MYLDINENIYKTDKLKVAFVLSLMNEKEVCQWKAHFIDKITRPDMKLDFPKFKDFLILIQHAFKPADQAGEAMCYDFSSTHVEHTFSFLLDDNSTLAATCADGSVFISTLLLI